ncbi:MAG: glycosyltransferase [Cyanobacteria bacterium J06626_23]
MKERRLLIVSQTENYRELVTSGRVQFRPEAMHALEAMTAWGFQVGEVGIMACQSNHPYNEVLDTGIRVIGTGLPADADPEQVLKVMADFCPTHLIMQVFEPKYFRWAIRNRIRMLALFERPLDTLSIQTRWSNYRLSKLLNHHLVDWVGNQGVSACQSLQQIGVIPDKIVPWSWPQPVKAQAFEPRQLRSVLASSRTALRLVYQGAILSSKGLGDLLIAIAHLKAKGRSVQLQAIGKGEIDRFKAQARRLQLADRIEFIERASDSDRLNRIRTADMLIVPSRHEHPESSPGLLYDGLTTCTPVVASDHPLFLEILQHGINAMIFPAGNARALAHRIERLLNQPQLYAQLSEAGLRVKTTQQTPMSWAELIDRWLQGGSEDRHWLTQQSLRSQLAQPVQPQRMPAKPSILTRSA